MRGDRHPYSPGCAALLGRGPAGSLCQPQRGQGPGAGKGPRSQIMSSGIFQPMRRRFFLGASLSLAASGALAQVEVGGQANRTPVRFSLSGTMEQGSLVMGSAPPGSLAALDGRPLRVSEDGRFAFGFAPDQTAPSLVTVRYPNGGGD